MAGTVQSDDELAETRPNNRSGTPLGSEEPAGEQVEKPLPADFSGIFQGGLFLLALLAALYAAREIVLPVVLASILKLLLQPAVSLLFGTLVAFGTALSGPASSWAARLPEGVPRLQEHLSFLRAPIEAVPALRSRSIGFPFSDVLLEFLRSPVRTEIAPGVAMPTVASPTTF